jgi:hypothetical protein
MGAGTIFWNFIGTIQFVLFMATCNMMMSGGGNTKRGGVVASGQQLEKDKVAEALLGLLKFSSTPPSVIRQALIFISESLGRSSEKSVRNKFSCRESARASE